MGLFQVRGYKDMVVSKRVELLEAMDLIARSCNDEDVIDDWLRYGIADGDADNKEELETYYAKTENFSDMMTTFLEVMKDAEKSGGLYYDGVLSK